MVEEQLNLLNKDGPAAKILEEKIRDKNTIFYFHLRYESWLRGEDYGPHPEEPSGKSTAAPQPTAEEFIFNPKNKDKPIPLCLLEPNTSKKRRHPIHKKKSIGKIWGTTLNKIIQNLPITVRI